VQLHEHKGTHLHTPYMQHTRTHIYTQHKCNTHTQHTRAVLFGILMRRSENQNISFAVWLFLQLLKYLTRQG